MKHFCIVWVISLLVLAGCDEDTLITGENSCSEGSQGCPCYGNGTCDEGLSCLDNFCVKVYQGNPTDGDNESPPDGDGLNDGDSEEEDEHTVDGDSELCAHNCSDNGECNPETGSCTCIEGWAGIICEIEISSDGDIDLCHHNCSDNGLCDPETGACECDPGYGDIICSSDNRALQCSEHSVYNEDTATCDCDEGWQGETCGESTLEPCYFQEDEDLPASSLEACFVDSGITVMLYINCNQSEAKITCEDICIYDYFQHLMSFIEECGYIPDCCDCDEYEEEDE